MGRDQHIQGAEALAGTFQFEPKDSIGLGFIAAPKQDLYLSQEIVENRPQSKTRRSSSQPITNFCLGNDRDASDFVYFQAVQTVPGGGGFSPDDVAHCIRVEHPGSNHNMSRFCGGLISRSVRKSSGTPAASSAAKISLQVFAGDSERIKSPLCGSRRT